MIETKLDGKTKDIVSENISKMKNLFPEVFQEDTIDFDKLKQLLNGGGEKYEVNADDERYNFTWKGKTESIQIAQTPSTGTLRPCKEESKNWDTTQNLYIEGDNLEVLKLLQKTYSGKIKMIYIDPPYNIGKDFVYKDNYRDNLENYIEQDENGFKTSSKQETSGRYHTNWLNMMYPRLKLARNLLKDDGVIFISIDDHEDYNLRVICNEIFGENNFVCEFIWQKTYSPKNNNKYVSVDHEMILCYARILSNIKKFFRLPRDEKANSMYKYDDNDGKGRYRLSDLTIGKPKGYDIEWNGKIYPEPKNLGWRYTKENMYKLIEEGKIYLPEDTSKRPSYKRYLSEVEGIISKTILPYNEVGHTDKSRKNLNKLIGDYIFDYPKPVDLIMRFLTLTTKDDDIILDFFSGSSTTAHAVMKKNVEDNGNRKFILVQLPEQTDEKSEAYKAGFSNICEIGKERIRRAGDKIIEETGNSDLDIGFKVFKLDSSNIMKWNPDYNNLKNNLLAQTDNLVDGRNNLDLVYEIMLKYGIDITLPIDEYKNDGYKLYSVGAGALIICLDDMITKDVANSIVDLK
ncbi:site-specific DNA-methyltransferase, partial [Methanosphaera stadtmanae]|uniref:site-specific DNA-methyltransferase n=1 Tax=Methanosphaera stadtmanae TaxID=2317 RepID=UPI002E7985CB